MRNRYEGTPLDMSGQTFSDVGAGSGYNPMRVRPLTWSSGGQSYFNERAIGTPQTGWNFVAQSRHWMPVELSAIIWFGVDDSSTTVHFPVYGSATRISSSFAGKGAQDGVSTPILAYDLNSAFTVFNLVANWAYSRWNVIYPEVYAKIISYEDAYFEQIASVDKQAQSFYDKQGAAVAIDFVSSYSYEIGNALVTEWGKFFGELFMKFRDGYVITPSTTNQACGCSAASCPYSSEWYARIVEDTGDHYKVPTETVKSLNVKPEHRATSKLDILAKR
jgi:dipeptidase